MTGRGFTVEPMPSDNGGTVYAVVQLNGQGFPRFVSRDRFATREDAQPLCNRLNEPRRPWSSGVPAPFEP